MGIDTSVFDGRERQGFEKNLDGWQRVEGILTA